MASFIQNAMLLMMLLVLFQMNECDAALLKRRYVNVTNDLPGDATLTLHCKSGDDDLGQQVLPPHASWEFNFRPSWISETLYYCSFDWPGQSTKWFDIYIHARDGQYCGRCLWSVRPDGPCRFNWDTQKEDCKQWNKT